MNPLFQYINALAGILGYLIGGAGGALVALVVSLSATIVIMIMIANAVTKANAEAEALAKSLMEQYQGQENLEAAAAEQARRVARDDPGGENLL